MTAFLDLAVSAFLLALFGAGPARRLCAPGASLWGLAGVAYGLGALLLTVESLALSAAGIPWTLASMALPLLALSGGLFFTSGGTKELARPAARVPLAALLGGTLAAAHLAFSLASSTANSVDFVLFYGVKAALFAGSRGIPSAVMGHPLFVHAAPRYPPLMPIVEAWGVVVAGKMPWRFAPAVSLTWFLAGVAAIGSRLRGRLGPQGGASVAAYWACAMALSFAWSYSGGDGEAPLVFYVGGAAAWLLTEKPGESRLLPSLFLAGAALSKQEGLLAALALTAGVLLRDAMEKRPRPVLRAILPALLPVAAVFAWFGYEKLTGIPVGYRPPGPIAHMDPRLLPSIVPDLLRNLDAGSLGLSWALPLVVLAANPKKLVRWIPALTLTGAVFAALLATYTSPVPIARSVVIARTLPRACQPVLSLLILGAGVVAFGDPRGQAPDA
ncbi:MAG TPA: hypothetical protein VE007_12770 [Thermoanaerobaculia bacterium]|nr:hypothetical protein [Thermoanaerobaculia bacterium]